MSVLIAAKLYWSTIDEQQLNLQYLRLIITLSLSLLPFLSLPSPSLPPFLSPLMTLTHQKFQTVALVSVSVIVTAVYLLIYEIWCQVNYSTAL